MPPLAKMPQVPATLSSVSLFVASPPKLARRSRCSTVLTEIGKAMEIIAILVGLAAGLMLIVLMLGLLPIKEPRPHLDSPGALPWWMSVVV